MTRERPVHTSSGGRFPSYRNELDTRQHHLVGDDWAGGVPAQYGVAPRVRVGGSKWFNLLWLVPIGLALLVVGVAVAKGIRGTSGVQVFIAAYPGLLEQPASTPVGFPAWLQWQHLLNVFFMLFIIRSGLTILTDHPRLYWTRGSTPGTEWFRTPQAPTAGSTTTPNPSSR